MKPLTNDANLPDWLRVPGWAIEPWIREARWRWMRRRVAAWLRRPRPRSGLRGLTTITQGALR